ncbi:MAG: hypothetical protein AAFX09_07020 [Pseudomonadota bacterium]
MITTGRAASLIVLGAIALAGCTVAPGAPPRAMSFTGANAPAELQAAPPVLRSGFEIAGSGFEAGFEYADFGGGPVALLRHQSRGRRDQAELSPVMPWMGDGVRRFDGVSDAGAPVMASFVAAPCEAGDEVYSHRVRLQMGQRSYDACARETGPNLPWSADLPALTPAIEACVRDSARSAIAHVRGAGSRRIVHAARSGDGVQVRFQYPGGARFECFLSDAGRPSWSVIGAHAPKRPSEAMPVFVPAFASGLPPQPGQACYVYEHVHDGAGRVIGALGHDACQAATPDAMG